MSSAQPIERIEIFELQSEVDDERPEESTIYDHALLFHSMGGQSFCICCMSNGPGIAEYLHFSEDSEVIDEMISGSHLRITIR